MAQKKTTTKKAPVNPMADVTAASKEAAEKLLTVEEDITTAEADLTSGKPKKIKRKVGEKLPEGMALEHRTTLLFRKQAWADLSILARIKRTTPNQIINEYVEQLLVDNADAISKFHQMLRELGEE